MRGWEVKAFGVGEGLELEEGGRDGGRGLVREGRREERTRAESLVHVY